MAAPALLFRLLNEFVFILLGALLALMAVSGRYGAPGRSTAWITLGAFLIYWGVRAWLRPERNAPRWQSRVRGASLVLVGTMVLAMAWAPFGYVAPLLEVAGVVLVLRGLASAAALYAQALKTRPKLQRGP